MRIRFLTSTPLDIRRGSGTYVGIPVLARALSDSGTRVDFETPTRRPAGLHGASGCSFNRRLRRLGGLRSAPWVSIWTATASPGSRAHVASLKGVIADEVRFESGPHALHHGDAGALRAPARAARGARAGHQPLFGASARSEFYGLKDAPAVVPELIDLAEWRRLLRQRGGGRPGALHRAVSWAGFYRRKRVDVLLRAAAILRERIPSSKSASSATGRARAACSGSPAS